MNCREEKSKITVDLGTELNHANAELSAFRKQIPDLEKLNSDYVSCFICQWMYSMNDVTVSVCVVLSCPVVVVLTVRLVDKTVVRREGDPNGSPANSDMIRRDYPAHRSELFTDSESNSP
jgi:hypothetical protein